MNMMRYDIQELEINAKLIDSSKVIDGYIYLSEELVEEKQQERREKRTTFLFFLLLLSVALYGWDRQWFMKTTPIVESYHSPAVTLSNVLSDTAVEHLPTNTAVGIAAEEAEIALSIPDDIIKFIDSDIAIEDKGVSETKVVLEEVKAAPDNTLNIDKILASGDRLFKRDRLMSPPVHNAFARYEKVLSISPEHPEALKGIENIVNRYVSLAEMVITKNEHYKVPELIKKAYQAGEKYMDVSLLISRFSDYLSNDSVLFDTAFAGNQAADNAGKSAGVTDSKAAKNNNEDGTTDGNHVDSIFLADREISATAFKLYSAGDVRSAQKVLENFTKLSGFWGESNDLLLRMYLSQKKIAQAENLIYENKALDAYQFAEKAARIMMARGDSQGALNMLSAYRPEFLENKSYYTLLASLHHKTGDFQRAIYWYRQLLSVDHEDARLWLGLAVSLDALNNVDDALQAFDYARSYAQNASVVHEYINERTLALAPAPATENQSL